MTLTAKPTRSSTRGVLASESRLQLLDTLRKNGRGMDVSELAEIYGLHVSTVRFHLGELRSAGLVDSHAEPSTGRGRPRKLFYPVTVGAAVRTPVTGTAPTAGADGYERLARVLAASWDEGRPDPERRNTEPSGRGRHRAEEAGRSWAASQLHVPPAAGQSSAGQSSAGQSARSAAVKVNGLFAEIGFDPELRHEGDSSRILLHACPFDSVAKDYPDVVCSLHLGLLRGALDQLGAEVESALQPRVTPHLCVATIGSHSASTRD